MHFKTLMLLVGLTSVSLAWAENDPYLWLEGVDDEKALDWVRAENAATAERLKSSPLFEELYADAKAVLNSSSRLPEVYQEGDFLYNFWRDENNPRGVFRRTTLAQFATDKPEWETVIDIDALGKKENQQWVFKGMRCLQEHPKHCLVSLSPGGGDAVVTREFNSINKTFVKGGFFLPLAKGGASWIDADTVFVSTDFGEGSMTDSGYPRIVKRWKRGTPLAQAKLIYEGDVKSVSANAFRLHSVGSDIDLIRDGKTFWTSDRYQLVDGDLKHLELPLSATVNGAFQGRLIISLKEDWTRAGITYPLGAVLIADTTALQKGGKGQVDVLIEPDDTTIVQSVNTTDSTILVTVLENVRGKIYRYNPGPEGKFERSLIRFPDNGSLEITSTDDTSGNFFARYESFTSPPALYYVASADWQPQKVKSQAPSFDGSRYQTEQYFATSADGTKIPYFVVLSKEAKRDGSNPTHIFSYGGFRNSLTPSYSGSYEDLSGAYGKLWLDRGGVFVLANIRGGGEFGPQWHSAALKENRHLAFEDFEAVAEDLIKRKITSPKHLGIEGRSNGGLLVGATLTRRPDLYGAVICGVPLLDMQRYHTLLAGASWMAEYGDPDIPEEWAYIKEYSPYQNLASDVDYPAVFFYTSTRDDRVHPGHARKMAARMKELDQEIWYYENMEGGHGGSTTNDQLAYRLALAYTHLWTQLK
ncbi:MAG: prolyl oligopeptidase family serine peptidase [Xanthomonadales bacterium]|nr:prolyl oligopeptidase family serine peptidase [Xanthomonadales bacterium]